MTIIKGMEESEISKLSYVNNANIKRWALFFFAIGKNQHVTIVTSRNEECEWKIDATVID